VRRKIIPAANQTWPPLPRGVVKSAGRALQILELFDDLQREATAVEVSRTLKYPPSSTAVLMHSLHTLGYLSFDSRNWTYRPTSRVRLLGGWINPPLFEEPRILRLVRELNALTGDTIVLAARNGLHAQYIHVAQAQTSLRVHLTPGTLRPIAASGAGWVLLSTLPQSEVSKLLRRHNAEGLGQKITAAALQRELQGIRDRGYVITHSLAVAGGSMLARLLPPELSESPLVIGVSGATGRIAKAEKSIVQVLNRTIRRYVAEARASGEAPPRPTGPTRKRKASTRRP
jgi:DNA-binding IclR family transcriptional regulator